jgi:hypothetical protein
MGIDISPMPVRHGQTPPRRLHLPKAASSADWFILTTQLYRYRPFRSKSSQFFFKIMGFCAFSIPASSQV